VGALLAGPYRGADCSAAAEDFMEYVQRCPRLASRK
jgi:hypothetical protein